MKIKIKNNVLLKITRFLCVLFSFPLNSQAQSSIITLWKNGAIGAIWNDSTRTVAYGKKDANGYYKIYLSDSSGNNEQLLTFPGWDPDRHQWAEEWHPSGKYLFCYVEKTDYAFETGHNRIPDDAIPGYGAYTDIWLVRRDGSQAWQLTDFPNNYNNGVIHGAISRDGTLFAWSQRIQAPNMLDPNLAAGAYVMKVADFIDGTAPVLANIRTYQPGGLAAANELDGISPDNSTLSFYSTFETKNLFNTPVYTLNMGSAKITRLTAESFAQAPAYTPAGDKIVYMTGKDCDIFPMEIQGADWWIMNTNGSQKLRITRMNIKDDPQSVNHYRLAGSISFISDSCFLGGVMTNPLGLTGYTTKVKILSTIGQDQDPEFYIYPNPASGILTIHLYNSQGPEQIQIHNILGELIKETEATEISVIDITFLPQGIYFLNLKRKPKVSIKFVKD
jgi:hypothetical protein